MIGHMAGAVLGGYSDGANQEEREVRHCLFQPSLRVSVKNHTHTLLINRLFDLPHFYNLGLSCINFSAL